MSHESWEEQVRNYLEGFTESDASRETLHKPDVEHYQDR